MVLLRFFERSMEKFFVWEVFLVVLSGYLCLAHDVENPADSSIIEESSPTSDDKTGRGYHYRHHKRISTHDFGGDGGYGFEGYKGGRGRRRFDVEDSIEDPYGSSNPTVCYPELKPHDNVLHADKNGKLYQGPNYKVCAVKHVVRSHYFLNIHEGNTPDWVQTAIKAMCSWNYPPGSLITVQDTKSKKKKVTGRNSIVCERMRKSCEKNDPIIVAEVDPSSSCYKKCQLRKHRFPKIAYRKKHLDRTPINDTTTLPSVTATEAPTTTQTTPSATSPTSALSTVTLL